MTRCLVFTAAVLALAPAAASAQLRFEQMDAGLPAGPAGAAGMAWTDVDGDGRVDVAIAARDSFPSLVFRNAGGRFEPVALPANRERNANSAAWADLDGDGDADLVLGQDSLAAYETRLQDGRIHLAPFASAGVLTTADHPRGGFEVVAAGDLDGDGDLDLVAGAHGRAGTFVLVNDGRAQLTIAQRDLFPFSSFMGGGHAADLDGDGRADLLFTGAAFPAFRVGTFAYWNALLALAGIDPAAHFRRVWPVLTFAFSSRSSAATIPLNVETQVGRLGVPPAIAGFSASFGATIGQNGCAGLYPAMLAVMIAPGVGIDPTAPQWILTLVLVVTLGSFGIAGVGGGATFAAIVVLSTLHLPIALAGLLISIEPLIDMGRTAVNVSGAMTAGAVTSRLLGRTPAAAPEPAAVPAPTLTGLQHVA